MSLMRPRVPPALPAVLSTAALAIGLVATASGQTSTSSAFTKPRTIAVVSDFVGALAQSKGRLAWLRGPSECPKAEILDLRTRRRVKVSSRQSRACPVIDSFGVLALDGSRVLWQGTEVFSNSQLVVSVFTAALSDRRTRVLGSSDLLRNGDLDYQPPLPMAGAGGRLLFYERCEYNGESGCDVSNVRTVVGPRARTLFKAVRPVGLAVAGKRFAVLEDRFGCCQYSPAWSPDGHTLAWTHQSELLAESADGSHRHVLATSHVDSPPTWAPDGSKLAFSRYEPSTDQSSIQVVNADGSAERALGLGRLPHWSPDGTKIAFVRADDVYRMNSDGSAEARLTSDHLGRTREPQWSPDGSKLLVQRTERTYLVDAVAGGAMVLAPPAAVTPRWSPDGTLIAFTDGPSLAVMNSDGSGVHHLTDNSFEYFDAEPAWSSDGAQIAFQRSPNDGVYGGQIFVIAADGSGGHRVSGPPHAGEPAWAPGRRLLAWGDDQSSPSYREGGLFVGSSGGTDAARIAGEDVAPVEIRDARSGTLLRSFVARGTAIAVAMSSAYVAVVVRNGTRLELHRYRADGAALGSSKLPTGANPFYLTVGTGVIVFATARRIYAVNAKTGSTRILANPAAPPVGLSILNRRVVWAENLGKKGARVRAIDLPAQQ